MADALTRFEWERAIRQLPLRPPMCKLVALMMATYGDKDGRNAHPGEDRLAVEIGTSTRTVREHLATLRDVGLLVRTFEGSASGRRRLADEYQLALPADVLTRIADHRKLASGETAGITGSLTSDHRKLASKHRKPDVKNTGSQLPPTTTSIKDVDHPSPTHTPSSLSSHCRARELGDPWSEYNVQKRAERRGPWDVA